MKAQPNPNYCVYVLFRMDAATLRRAKAAALLAGVTAQEYISDALNRVASADLKLPQEKRQPPPPKGKGRAPKKPKA